MKNQVMAYAIIIAISVWFIAGLAVTDAEGRLVGVALVATGIALIGTITAFIASWFAAVNLQAEEMIQDELSLTEGKIEALTKEISDLKAMVGKLIDTNDGPSAPTRVPPGDG